MAHLTYLDVGAPVRVEGCQGCGACLLTCPEHALRPVPGGLLVRADRCTGCLECVEVCPVDAIVPVAPAMADPQHRAASSTTRRAAS